MGKVEKFAVLSVLFLIAVILVVSMTTDNPLDKSNAALLGEKPSSVPHDPAPAAEPPSKLLSATLESPPETPAAPTPAPTSSAPTPTTVVPQPLPIPEHSLLKTTEGLSPGFDSQRLLYAWQSGDSYVTLAKRFYSVPTKFTLIQNANEGREDVQPGEKILIPIYDVEPSVETPEALATKKDAAKKEAAGSTKSAPTSASGHVHTVKKGESLWKIAKAELGEGSRWNEIYELNKDKLKTPEALRDGMQLRLP